MNRQITRLFVGVVVLFVVLIAATTWWTVPELRGDALKKQEIDGQRLNQRPLL